MVSAAEQLAANLNFGALAKADELKKRIWFTLGALLVYRLGTYIPLPGIDPAIWEQVFKSQAGGILGMFNMFAGGGIHRMAIFALNIMPYISASIIIQLLTTVSPQLEALKKEGEAGRKTLNQYTRYLTVLLAAFQSYGIAVGLEGAGNVDRDHADRRHHVPDVARRADHLARHRQRHLTDHPVRHRRGIAVGARQHARTRPHRWHVDRTDPDRDHHGGRRDRLHRVHGARAAPPPDPVSEAPGRQQDVRGPVLASAAQAQYLGRHSADLRFVAAAVADHGRQLQRRQGAGMDAVADHAAQPRPAAIPVPVSGADRVLRLLLHRDRVQPDRDRGQSEEAWRLHPGHPPGRAHRRIHRLCAVAHHGARRGVSGDRLLDPGNPDLLRLGAVLFRRHFAPDRGQRDHGYGGAGPGLSAGASVRRPDPQIQIARTPTVMNELARRIAFTIGALLVFRFGIYIPLAGTTGQGLPPSVSAERVSIF